MPRANVRGDFVGLDTDMCTIDTIKNESGSDLIKRLSHLPEVVLDGVGILFAPFLRDLRTYDREAVNDALGILTKHTHSEKQVLNKGETGTCTGGHFFDGTVL